MTITAAPAGTGRASLAVDLDGVVKRFGPFTAVDGISLAIRPGEVVALLGSNGAGTTTTVDMLLGLARPTAGGGPAGWAKVLGPAGLAGFAVAYLAASAVLRRIRFGGVSRLRVWWMLSALSALFAMQLPAPGSTRCRV
jgi:ABC-type uncharacterized transport system ATPase subunit